MFQLPFILALHLLNRSTAKTDYEGPVNAEMIEAMGLDNIHFEDLCVTFSLLKSREGPQAVRLPLIWFIRLLVDASGKVVTR